jgi:hypothetical protein
MGRFVGYHPVTVTSNKYGYIGDRNYYGYLA